MIKVQVSVTPNEAKRLIARAVSRMPVVRSALREGKVVLKGGTTVSAIAEELTGMKLGISGRVSQRGTKTADAMPVEFHMALLEAGRVVDLSSESALAEVASQMGGDDVLITGANALDVNRRAAMMLAAPLGGVGGRIQSIMARGVTTIIAVGWEKLIPCPIEDALAASGRERVALAMGAAVGLIPVWGTVITETDAVSMLTGVKATVIGTGGIMGGEGSTTFVIEGEQPQVRRAWEIVRSVKGSEISGTPVSLIECDKQSIKCSRFMTYGDARVAMHRACAYRQPELARKVFSANDI